MYRQVQVTSLIVQIDQLVEFKTSDLRFNIYDLERSGLSGKLAGTCCDSDQHRSRIMLIINHC